MPSEQQKNTTSSAMAAQPEKPFHYTYLKEFRTQQCQEFLQHKCPNHRPFTCFHWHFLNQRRRRPVRKRDGTFNYSPDVYCTKFDETTGICPDDEECAFLHRTTGDTERRYHLRYYKTGTCVHETDARGHCVKNGPHCAFAHGPHGLRQPVYDIREVIAQHDPAELLTPSNGTGSSFTSSTSLIQEKDKSLLIDDPRWQVTFHSPTPDTNFVLANYKTELCKKPPRLCRQGYACPHCHNTRDRRRSPHKFHYRSTPCPNVKHGDEWGEPENCEQGDQCPYCHTRTEQQFHPEIYKSTKCNDMQQTGNCPRGPFCAFAHVDQEMTAQRDFSEDLSLLSQLTPTSLSSMVGNTITSSLQQQISFGESIFTSVTSSSAPGPIAKPRSNSTSSSYSSDSLHFNIYPRAPGSEREDSFSMLQPSSHLQSMNPLTTTVSSSSSTASSAMSATATPFYPTSDTVESVIGNALDDMNLDDIDVAALEKELDNDTSSISSSVASIGHLPSSLGYGSSAPVSIPGSSSSIGSGPNNKSSVTDSPSSPMSQLSYIPHLQHQQQQQQLEQAAAAFMSQPNTTPYMRHMSINRLLDSSGSAIRGPHSPHTVGSNPNSNSEDIVRKFQEEISVLKNKLHTWEESWNQAKQACDAWKKEAHEASEKAKLAEREKQVAMQLKEEAFNEAKSLKQDIEGLTGGPFLHILNKVSDLNNVPLGSLKQLQMQLKSDLDRLERIIHTKEALLCCVCQERERSIATSPCHHLVLCDICASSKLNCPVCHSQITSKLSVAFPL
ncbi:putative E3 ubiquitin-protein ligase UNKL isoform X1 [Asterias rubens]|uniref:putative E3 ubiquitin-protein ligase UNKL isoform X1 n=1 Tax=Asterias rubens TaxID=7604 RepID=UPI001455D9FD|nr:putative E3 ubiquitin-protein ligase UNKL isoform X1 [Asterias rubens]